MSSPNAALASFCAARIWFLRLGSLLATRMPLPPPPDAALIMIGYPIVCATRAASTSSLTAPSEPGTTGTLAAMAISRARDLSPTLAMTSGSGPMKPIWQDLQTSAKWAFSARKP